MGKLGKIIVGTGIGAGIVFALTKLLGKKKLGDKLDSITQASIHNFDEKGLVVRIDVVLKNPTEYSVRIRQPYIRLLVGNTLVGTSQVKSNILEIKSYSAAALKEPIYITIPLSKLLTLGGTFYQALAKQQPVIITVNTLSSIDLGAKWIGYDRKDPITLKPKLPSKTKQNANHGSKK